jgi:hypothetical protein
MTRPRSIARWLSLLGASLGACTVVESTTPGVTVTTATFDPDGSPADPHRAAALALGAELWGIGASAGQPLPSILRGELPQDPEQAERERAAAIRARFGSGVVIRPDGKVTKQYPLVAETSKTFLNLLAEPGQPVPDATKPQKLGGSQSVLGQMLAGKEVELFYFSDFDPMSGSAIATPVTSTAPAVLAAPTPFAMVLATASPEALAAFEDALNLFFAFRPQVEIEVKIVEYATNDSLDIGVEQVDKDTPILGNLSTSNLVKTITSSFPISPTLIGGTSSTDRGTITIGGIHDSWELNARLLFLESNNIVDIVSRPRMVVRNGGLATVNTVTKLPFPKAKITSTGQNIVSDIDFRDVGVTMNIRPVIAGTDTVILEVFADVSSVIGFADTDPVDTPIIASRKAITSVHVPNGKTTVIGGLESKSKFDRESKIPLLGDVPVLGMLFRSTSSQESTNMLEFHITPRIIEGPRGFAAR